MRWEPHRRLLTIAEAAESVARPESTIRRWLSEGRLVHRGHKGRAKLLLESEVLQADADTRRRRPRVSMSILDQPERNV